MAEKICKQCFEPIYRDSPKAIYCSVKCKNNAHGKKRRLTRLKPKSVISCNYCGNQFIALNGNQKSCSAKCNRDSHRLLNWETIKKKQDIKNKLYREKNRILVSDISEEERLYRNERARDLYHKNRDKRLQQRKEQRDNNPERFRSYANDSYKRNRDTILQKIRFDRKYDIKYKIKENIRGAIARIKVNHSDLSIELISGFTKKDYLDHLTFDPLFSNWVKDSGKYHIDHIVPISFYNIDDINDLNIYKACDPRNLRIIPAFDNLSKGDRFDMNLVKQYGIEDLLPEGIYV